MREREYKSERKRKERESEIFMSRERVMKICIFMFTTNE